MVDLDGAFSMEPEEFAAMVEDIHKCRNALGVVTYNLTEVQKMARNMLDLFM